MTPAAATSYTERAARPLGWLAKSEAWLDSKGKGAWIAAMVLGFVFFWPVGLALLFYMIWSKQMFRKSCRSTNGSSLAMRKSGFAAMKSSGNVAFDNYKSETLRRLEEEQEQFESFLERLREAKDKAEFDEFMNERAKKTRDDTVLEDENA